MQSNFYYEVLTPTKMEEGKKYPILFALHGIGHSEKDMLPVFEGAKEKYILIGVRGHIPHKDGYAYYKLKGYGIPVREQFDESIVLLKNFIEYACEKYPVDRERVYIGGFSQGAILSNSLAIVLGDKVRGIVSLNGYVPTFLDEKFELKSIAHLSIFLSVGEFDTIFPPEVGKKNYDYFTNAGATVFHKTYRTGHEISAENVNDITSWMLNEISHNNIRG